MQTIVESAIYEGIDKCTDNIGYFVYLKEYRKKDTQEFLEVEVKIVIISM